MTNANATADTLRAEAAQHEADRAASFERCDTDGFVSQWASGMSAQLARAQAEIVENGGMAEFAAPMTELGSELPHKLIKGAYGYCFALTDAQGSFTGVFLPLSFGERSKHYKAGYRIGTVKAPARARLYSPPSARGLSGATQVQVIVERI